MQKFQRYFNIAKLDDDQRMVYGYASTPDLDSDGEIISLDAIKEALPGYLKFPTLREMHQPKAAGTVKEAAIHDGDKQGLYIGAKVVTDDAWKLVKEGVYKAFSIGGNVLKRVGNMITGLDLVEISLVDSPANKAAVIELWKSDKASGTLYEKSISALEGVELPDTNEGKLADAIRRGVIVSMNEEELKKAADQDKAKTEEVKETATEETKTEEVVAEETGEAKAEETAEVIETTTEAVDVADEKDAAQEATILKLDEIDEKLSKVGQTPAVTTVVEKTVSAETITKVVESLGKFADAMISMSEKVEKLEKSVANIPAAAKSRAAFVTKSIATQDGEQTKTEVSNVESDQDKARKARLEELRKLRSELSANEFAKQGYSQEAANLLKEMGR